MNLNKIKFSILIPLHNAEHFVRRAVDSVLRQKYRNFEILICDDASEDDSWQVVSKYAQNESCIRLIQHRENTGPHIARMDLLAQAQGQYIVFLDADDELTPHSLLYASEAVARNNDAEIIEFSWSQQSTNKHMESCAKLSFTNKACIKGHEILSKVLLSSFFTWTVWGKIYRRDFLTKYMPADIRSAQGEDLAANIVLLYYASTYLYLNKKFYIYHIEDGATGMQEISSEQFKKSITDLSVSFQYIDVFFKNVQVPREVLTRWAEIKRSICNTTLQKIIEGRVKKNEMGEALLIFRNIFGSSLIAEYFKNSYILNSDTPISKFITICRFFLKTVIIRWWHRLFH